LASGLFERILEGGARERRAAISAEGDSTKHSRHGGRSTPSMRIGGP